MKTKLHMYSFGAHSGEGVRLSIGRSQFYIACLVENENSDTTPLSTRKKACAMLLTVCIGGHCTCCIGATACMLKV